MQEIGCSEASPTTQQTVVILSCGIQLEAFENEETLINLKNL